MWGDKPVSSPYHPTYASVITYMLFYFFRQSSNALDLNLTPKMRKLETIPEEFKRFTLINKVNSSKFLAYVAFVDLSLAS